MLCLYQISMFVDVLSLTGWHMHRPPSTSFRRGRRHFFHILGDFTSVSRGCQRCLFRTTIGFASQLESSRRHGRACKIVQFGQRSWESGILGLAKQVRTSTIRCQSAAEGHILVQLTRLTRMELAWCIPLMTVAASQRRLRSASF